MYGAERKRKMSSQEYMKKLAEQFDKGEIKFLDGNDEFEFTCDQCGRCCRNREDIIITPFDLYHLVRATGKSAKEVIAKYGNMYVGSNSNLPLIQFRYREEPDGSTTCYFLGRKDGKYICRVHEDKPCVCRTFPLGKMSAYKTSDGKQDLSPKYFRQEVPARGECPGSDRSRDEHIMQRVVDWVGGEKKKILSDRYSSIFNQFMQDYSKVFNEKTVLKRRKSLIDIFFNTLGLLMYLAYDFSVDDDSFLDSMEQNLNEAMELTRLMMTDTDAMMNWIISLFDRLQKKGIPEKEAV